MANMSIAVPLELAFYLSHLIGPTSQFLNGTHEFSELVLARMVLLMDQSRSVLPLRSANAGKNVQAHLGSPLKMAMAGQTGQMESDLLTLDVGIVHGYKADLIFPCYGPCLITKSESG